jgi:Glycogen recognition site of AMP-activated protein kinase
MRREREDLNHDDPAFDRLMAPLGRDRVTLPPTVRAAVMARVRAAAASPWRRAWSWANAPRLSPLAGALAAAAVLVAILLSPAGTGAPPAGSTTAVAVRFVFIAPSAKRVAITGDWVHWDPAGIPLTSSRQDGVWAAEIAVPPGLHHYVFVIDGTEWRPDPNAASQVDDGFGQRNSVLLVSAQRAS